ncbi:MAG TPA: FAD-dependent monooxygenase [Jatrophihabitans sp.]|nr:FAD-dependent monooxygenase [Jatrophihabitans sp.]
MRGDAVVVGAGIGGLCTAIGLRRAGWTVRVLERWPEVVGIGAALGVWPEASRGLARVGLADAFAAASVPVAAAAVYRRDGGVLLRIPDDSPRIPPVRLISRRRLMDLLLEQAGGIEIRTGVAAAEPELRAALADTDVLIGADGLRSGVRAAFFRQERCGPRYSGLIGWRGYVDFESGGYGETWADGAIFGNTPMAPGKTNFYAALRAPEDGVATFTELRGRYAGWRGPIPRILTAASEDDVLRNPIYDLHPPLRSFVTDRVALLGDAAHAMTPHLGRGACEAISDADSLVARLTEAAQVATALRAYDRQRRKPAQRIARRSWQMMRVSHARGAPARVRDTLVRGAGLVVR